MNVRFIQRKTPSHSAKVSDEFRKSKGLILVTSNLPAGVDYPDVTLVIQVGAPSNRAQYIHRLGGTGHGKKAQGMLLLAPYGRISFYLASRIWQLQRLLCLWWIQTLIEKYG
ncbi:hypothetical protein J1N35_001560 [Gossypium stocksii]|uniref:ATP-dependent RNA helicase n=1 Tax=Gossypium stocksii TaxID=47602 RepID=A0A9D3WHY5_9ROSI|nr:hypothetical protein J1N35_001560 [Gossypium stocksii]